MLLDIFRGGIKLYFVFGLSRGFTFSTSAITTLNGSGMCRIGLEFVVLLDSSCALLIAISSPSCTFSSSFFDFFNPYSQSVLKTKKTFGEGKNKKGRDCGYALATGSCEEANSVDACTVTTLDVITAFAVPNLNCPSLDQSIFSGLAASRVAPLDLSLSLLRIGNVLFSPTLSTVDACDIKILLHACQRSFQENRQISVNAFVEKRDESQITRSRRRAEDHIQEDKWQASPLAVSSVYAESRFCRWLLGEMNLIFGLAFFSFDGQQKLRGEF